jgi:hypothetical protein
MFLKNHKFIIILKFSGKVYIANKIFYICYLNYSNKIKEKKLMKDIIQINNKIINKILMQYIQVNLLLNFLRKIYNPILTC